MERKTKNIYWEESKIAEKRSLCFKGFSSETLHAVLAVTSCSDLVAWQINKFRIFFFSLVSLFPWQTQNILVKPSFWKMSPQKSKNRKERFKTQSPSGWHLITDREEERSSSLQTFAMEVDYVLKLKLFNVICFTARTCRRIFLQGLVLIQSANLFVKEGVPVPIEFRKKGCQEETWSHSRYGEWKIKQRSSPVS